MQVSSGSDTSSKQWQLKDDFFDELDVPCLDDMLGEDAAVTPDNDSLELQVCARSLTYCLTVCSH